MINEDAVKILERPFTKSEIKAREGSFGKMLSYVEGHSVIARLNEAFQNDWSYEILRDFVQSEELVVHVRITVRAADGSAIMKDGYGGKKLTKTKEKVFMKEGVKTVIPSGYLDLSSDYKAASTDALKKAATLLGIGLDLYSNDDAPDDKPTPAKVHVSTAEAQPDLSASEPANPGQKAAISALVKKTGKDIGAILKTIGAKDLDSLTMAQAGKAIAELQVK